VQWGADLLASPRSACFFFHARSGRPPRSRASRKTTILRRCCQALVQSRTPKLLAWGEDAPFQTVDYAERYAREIPETVLVRIKSAGHIPVKNAPRAAAGALAEFFVAER
jgi:pimeloyl-ACP methyl ester carboxylesterase